MGIQLVQSSETLRLLSQSVLINAQNDPYNHATKVRACKRSKSGVETFQLFPVYVGQKTRNMFNNKGELSKRCVY